MTAACCGGSHEQCVQSTEWYPKLRIQEVPRMTDAVFGDVADGKMCLYSIPGLCDQVFRGLVSLPEGPRQEACPWLCFFNSCCDEIS